MRDPAQDGNLRPSREQAPGRMAGSRVMLVLNALHSGGTEATCVELARGLDTDHEVTVLALHGGGPAEAQLRSAGIRTRILSTGTRAQLTAGLTLRCLLRESQPDAVVTFLYLSDLLGGTLARRYAPRARVFWNIRNNLLRWGQTGHLTYVVSRANARLSRSIPHRIVYCSPLARAQHEAIGYNPAVATVVENSAESVRFGFSAAKRRQFRSGARDGNFLFLLMGRFDPVKRVDLYLAACAEVARRLPGVRFLAAGRGMEAANERLRAAAVTAGVPQERLELLGHVDDPQLLHSAADCLVVTSESEGSPNVVYEAIATSLPVIILGTAGTEEIRAPGVTRLAQRDAGSLADAMATVAAAGLPSVDARARAALAAPAAHPLVTYYREALAS